MSELSSLVCFLWRRVLGIRGLGKRRWVFFGKEKRKREKVEEEAEVGSERED